ncbi:30S ribosome-binding factor RbfA [Sulfuriferula thiophila]|uniref:30S ribosome-binding factor RbfA n=1 Tax=Sulfuriferula thiophila TaxID=1781211 RepID=UPI000F61467A|nr:30S ribosome-binding factor RbfA [Sulfuriferula thiophila]
MAKDYPRSRRVAEQIQRELADIIRTEIHDPRVGMITITEVVVTHDLEHAKVYFTVFESLERAQEAAHALNHAAGFIRSQLGPRMRLRIVPQITFVYDTSVARGAELSRLIDEAVAADTARPDDNHE